VLLGMLALSAALLVLGYVVTPVRVARWPSVARIIDERDHLFVLAGLSVLAAAAVCLVLFSFTPP
jgi:hypothetical protein